MSGIASNFPRGLLDLLGLQTQGAAPSLIPDTVSPTIELLDMYLAGRLASLGGSQSTPLAGFNPIATLTVPASEVWVVKALSAFGTTEAGVTFQISPAWLPSDTGGTTAITLAPPQAIAASSSSSNAMLPAALWLPAGSRLGVRVDALTGAPTAASSVTLSGVFARFRAGS